ncbi:MAG: hypothetical protein WBO54_09660 [Thermoanaerobaculia bacterium]
MSHTPGRYRVLEKLFETLGITILAGVLTAFYLRPITRLWRDHIAPNLGDPLFNTYLLRWVQSNLSEGLGRVFSSEFWSPPFFFPFEGALALSDHMIGPGLLTLPVASAPDSPAAAYNLLLASSFVLALVIGYLVLRLTGLEKLSSLFASLAFAFSPYRWDQLSHIQMLLVAWVPLTLWSWDRLLRRPSAALATLFLASYTLHVLGGTYLAFMIHVPLLVIAINRLSAKTKDGIRQWKQLASPHSLVLLTTVVIAGGALTATIFAPYLEVSELHEMTRTDLDLRRYGATTIAFLTPPDATRYSAMASPLKSLARGYEPRKWNWEKSLFPGFLPAIMAAIGLGSLMVRNPTAGLARWKRRLLGASAATAVAAFLVADIISFGVRSPPFRIGRFYDAALAVILASVIAWLLLGWRWGRGMPFRFTGLSVWGRGLLAAGFACVLLAFPVFFEPLSDLLPGLGGMRVPARFWALGLFPFAFLGGIGFAATLRKLTRPGILGSLLIVILLFELAPRPLRWTPLGSAADLPGVNSWLVGRDDVSAILELPSYHLNDELRYMYWSSFGWVPLANGYSGHFPASYRAMRQFCCNPIPDTEGLISLRRMGISHLVVNSEGWRKRDRRRVRTWLRKARDGELGRLREVYVDDQGNRVLQLVRPGARVP